MANGPSTDDNWKPTTEDALTYLKDLKLIFKNERWRYKEFLTIMGDFKAKRIDTEMVTARVRELLRGHPHLFLGFNIFLPKEYEIVPPTGRKSMGLNDARNFIERMRERFQNEDHVYKTFLGILNAYRDGIKSIDEVWKEVCLLLQNDRDLIKEFSDFLPEHLAPALLNDLNGNDQGSLDLLAGHLDDLMAQLEL